MVKLARWTAWSLLAVLVVVTLSPLALRPQLGGSPTVERVAAYTLVGLAFSLAYPRQRLAGLAICVACAGLLELGQTLTQTRHGRMPDFLVKALAAGFGLALGCIVQGFGRTVRERRIARS